MVYVVIKCSDLMVKNFSCDFTCCTMSRKRQVQRWRWQQTGGGG